MKLYNRFLLEFILNLKNIKAVSLNSETFVPVNEYKNYKIIYTTPEFIMSRMPAFFIGMLGWFAVLYLIFMGEAAKANTDSENKAGQMAFNALRMIVLVGLFFQC